MGLVLLHFARRFGIVFASGFGNAHVGTRSDGTKKKKKDCRIHHTIAVWTLSDVSC
jgi:hypothetical protein